MLDKGLDMEHLHYKDQMVEYFGSIRDRINVEDLRMLPAITCGRIKNECHIC